MIEKRKWVDVSDARPEPGKDCIVRRVMPDKEHWCVSFDFICEDTKDWQFFLHNRKLGTITHWRYVKEEEIDELAKKRILLKRHPIEEKYVDNWDYNWYD